MTTDNNARRAHDVLDGLFAGRILSRENEQLLRSFLPELPKQKTLKEVTVHVFDAWVSTNDNDWAGTEENPDMPLEHWLAELHKQLKGVNSAVHPEFLETEEDYDNAPEGTIVAVHGSKIPTVKDNGWPVHMAVMPRRVLRWGL